MPTYVYEILESDGCKGERFEVMQKMSDPPLEHHPETGQPVRRVIVPARILGQWSEMKSEATLRDDRKLDQMGFTKYVKSGDGTYEKRAGQGPQVLGGGSES